MRFNKASPLVRYKPLGVLDVRGIVFFFQKFGSEIRIAVLSKLWTMNCLSSVKFPNVLGDFRSPYFLHGLVVLLYCIFSLLGNYLM